MTTSNQGAADPGAIKAPTAEEVIAMFRAIGLPVTDDGAEIEVKGKTWQQTYLRWKGETDPQKRNLADAGFCNVTRLINERPKLLGVVRNFFTQQSDLALNAALAGGARRLNAEMVHGLTRLAEEQCRCTPPLARAFVDGYLRERRLVMDGPLVFPRLVEGLSAQSTPGQVELRWTLPAQDCDEVVVRRYAGSGDATAANAGREVCRGACTSFADREVRPGEHYRYLVHSVRQGTQSEQGVAVQVVGIGEIAEVRAVWEQGAIKLTWQKPADACDTLIYRAATPVGAVRRGGQEPAVDQPGVSLAFRGREASWRDAAVAPDGATWHYRLVARFAPGWFSDGVISSLRTPLPPPAVTAVQAVCVQGRIDLSWQPVRGPQSAGYRYVVVCREGDLPPTGPADGRQVAAVEGAGCSDLEVVAGRRYTYAVFTWTGEVYALRPGVAAPCDCFLEVTGLLATAGDGAVELHWRTPEHAHAAVVRRGPVPPAGPHDGIAVPLTGAADARATGLENGTRQHFLVCCTYRRPDGVLFLSPGLRTQAVPEPDPVQVDGYSATTQGPHVLFHWTPPAHGQVVLVRSAERPPLLPGQRVDVQTIDQLGERIRTGAAAAADLDPDPLRTFYSVFTVAGTRAVFGGTATAVVSPDISELRVQASDAGVVLRWVWPPGCTSVRILRRADDWPVGPDDPQAVSWPWTLAEYSAAGEHFADRSVRERGRYRYAVFAQARGGTVGPVFSPGAAPGCRVEVQWEQRMTLRYRVGIVRPRRGRPAGLRLTWGVTEAIVGFAGFVLLAKETEPPGSLEDGVEVFRWTPGIGAVAGDHEATAGLDQLRQRRWSQCYCKLFLLDPAQAPVTLVVYPNTCIPLSCESEPEGESEQPLAYRFGVPRTVICPQCFEEFPLDSMRFASYTSDCELHARYGWWQRLLERPLQVPKAPNGELLARKRCPSGHDLPFTAGTQSSLVIGVIGAKFSGKSHYIAALIDRLAGQVGSDLQADLIPVTDETAVRYRRDMYDPLFGRRLELRATTGTPQPLIYDLYFNGRLWGERRSRGVTLALYDTAGENFDDPAVVRRMVRYLRVAAGIMFLVDPLQTPAVRGRVSAAVPLPDDSLMAQPHEVISRVLAELEQGRIIAQSGPLATPVAVVLTKCDVLRDAGLIAGNRLWGSQKRHVGYFDREAHDDMNGMMGEYMAHWGQKAYNTVRTRFPRHGFFGVSATGCAADKATGRYRFVAPWRVEDPLLWLLAELGVIPAR